MTPVLTVLGILAFLVGWNFFLVKRSGRPWWNPLWMAFTLTASALLYGVAGVLGYAVPWHNPFIDHPPVWVGHVVWPQVETALVVALISVPAWWLGLRGLQRSS